MTRPTPPGQVPEALRLVEMLTANEWPGHVTLVSYARECVAELLRQHAENETLRAGYAAARLEIESLKAQLHAAKQINAAQSDSGVQEDAALLDWLEQHDGRYYNLDKVAAIVGTGFLVRSEGNMPQVHSTLREAVCAARKQGEKQ